MFWFLSQILKWATSFCSVKLLKVEYCTWVIIGAWGAQLNQNSRELHICVNMGYIVKGLQRANLCNRQSKITYPIETTVSYDLTPVVLMFDRGCAFIQRNRTSMLYRNSGLEIRILKLGAISLKIARKLPLVYFFMHRFIWEPGAHPASTNWLLGVMS